MHYYQPQKRQFHNSSEKRLCRRLGNGAEDLGRMHETLKANEQLKNNKDIQEALSLYDNALVRGRHADILTSQSKERPYVLTLILDGILNKRDAVPANNVNPDFDYQNVQKNQINPADPFDLIGRFDRNNGTVAEKNKQLGVFLRSFIEDEEVLEDISPDWNDDTKLGSAYRLIVQNARTAWRDPNLDIRKDDTLYVDVSMLWYKHISTQLDDRMRTNGVRPPSDTVEYPGDEDVDGTVAKRTLSKEQYLILLRRSSENGGVLPYADLDVMKTAGDKEDKDARLTEVFTDVSIEKYGPSETLKRFGIVIGPYMHQKYADGRKGIFRDSRGEEYKPQNGEKTLESAAEWRRNPKVAYDFLLKNMPSEHGASNKIFLDSLEWHFVFNDKDRSVTGGGKPEDLMKKDDTEAALTAISQTMLVYSGSFNETSRQRKALQEEVSVTQGIENMMGDSWEYMKDFSSHPIGSSLMWLAAIGAVRIIHGKFLKGEVKVWKIGALGVVAFNVFRKHQNGHNIMIDPFVDMYDGFMENEKSLDPRKRTLPNYWKHALEGVENDTGFYNDLPPDKEHLALTMMGEAPTDKLLKWYEEWGIHRNGPSGGRAPKIPLKWQKYSSNLGEAATSKQVGDYLYLTMHKFFVHRGRDVKRTNLTYDIPGAMSEDEGLGFAYIKEKYITHRFYKRLVEDLDIPKSFTSSDVKIEFFREDGTKITDEELRVNHPIYYAQHQKYLAMDEADQKRYIKAITYLLRLYETEKFGVPSRNYDFDHVFFMEGNPETIQRTDEEGAEGAGLFEKMGAYFATWKFWEGNERDLPTSTAGTAQQLPTGHPGQVRRLAQVNPGLFLSTAQANPGQLQAIATNTPGLLHEIATDNPGTLALLAQQHPGVFEGLATNNPGFYVGLATGNPGSFNTVVSQNPGVANNLLTHTTEFQTIATANPGVLLVLVQNNQAELVQFATNNPDKFHAIVSANAATVNTLATAHQAKFLQLATVSPDMILMLATNNPDTLEQVVATNPAAFKLLMNNNLATLNKLNNDHTLLHEKMKRNTPAAF